MFMPDEISSTASSLGMIALAGYISSPSSTYSYESLPRLLGYSQTQSQYINEQDLDTMGNSFQTIWLLKPRAAKYGLPKIK